MKKLFIPSLVCFQLLLAKEKFETSLNPFSEQYVDNLNRQNLSWKAKRYLDESWTTKDLMRFFGVLPDHKLNGRGLDYRLKLKSGTTKIPEFFDAREKWSECESIGMVRDQSTCGSCWVRHM